MTEKTLQGRANGSKPAELIDCPRCHGLFNQWVACSGRPVMLERSCLHCGCAEYKTAPSNGRIPILTIRYGGPHPRQEEPISAMVVRDPTRDRPDLLPVCPFDGQAMTQRGYTNGKRPGPRAIFKCGDGHKIRIGWNQDGALQWWYLGELKPLQQPTGGVTTAPDARAQ